MEPESAEYSRIICSSADEVLEEILDFANMVFSMDSGCIDFADFYPKAYAEGRCGLVTHHIIKENQKIRALVDCYPLTLRLNKAVAAGGKMELKAAYIGTVSVHPNTRNKGYMTKLMEYALADARQQGCALVLLDGNRHRYRHFGFERAGIKYSFQVGFRNVMHCCRELYDAGYMENPVYGFEEIDSSSELLDYLYGLYCRRNVTARSREDFPPCLGSGHTVTYAVFKRGRAAGYINMSEDEKTIMEYEAADNSEFPRIIYDLMMGADIDVLKISVGMDELEKTEYIEKMSDCCSVSMSHQIKILDYEEVLSFLFHWKQKYDRISANEYVIGIRDEKNVRNYGISVSGEDIKITYTDKKADIILGETELISMLTTSFSFFEQRRCGGKINNAPAGWFPLPFYLPDADAF